MYIPTILNFLIGMLFIWLVTSLVVMFIHEWLATRLKWRPKMLETTIRNMLSDPALTDQLYNHPLIRSLYSGPDGASKPSYIPASQFAQALMDIVVNAASEASLYQHYLYKLRWELPRLDPKERPEAQKRLNLLLALTRRALAAAPDPATQDALLEEIRSGLTDLAEGYPALKTPIESVLGTVGIQQNQIREAIKASEGDRSTETGPIPANRYRSGLAALSVTHPRLKQTLGALLSELINASIESENGLFRARQNLEEWFNNSMDRLTGWYRRRAQTLAYTIALLVALVLNIDSIQLAQTLWQDPVSAARLADEAALVAQNPSIQISEDAQRILQEQIYKTWYLSLPIGWIGLPVDPILTPSPLCPWEIAPDLSGVRLFGQCYPLLNLPANASLIGWLAKLAGLVITGIAAAQGAPFWFDLLKKVVNIRMTGANPVETKRVFG
jgi:hypothetical protein